MLIDKFLDGAIEVDVDAIADGSDVYIAGVMQQIEEAGVHSGNSACALPPFSLQPEVEADLRRQTRTMARQLGVVGLMNVQYAIRGDEIYVLEVNPRASRTVPFVAKATSVPVAKIAARVMAGEPLARFGLTEPRLEHVAVKEVGAALRPLPRQRRHPRSRDEIDRQIHGHRSGFPNGLPRRPSSARVSARRDRGACCFP